MSDPLRHLVLFTFHPHLSAQQVEDAVLRFTALGRELPEVLGFEYGQNISHEGLDRGYQHCFLLTFRDEPARDHYLLDPLHQGFVDFIGPLLANVCVLDFFGKSTIGERQL